MAWRIYLKNPRLEGSNHTAYNSTVSPETCTLGMGPGAVTLFSQGGDDWWLDCRGFWPELPGELTGRVTKVTFLGAPPTKNITPGLYEIGKDSASVEPNGDKLKVELRAATIEGAKDLWRKLLKNDESVRTVAYAA